MTDKKTTGQYPIAHRAGEIERLHIQGQAIAFDAAVMLNRIKMELGWRCLDLGCGPGGITALLSERVGPQGSVVGLDADSVFLEHARQRVDAAANVKFVQGNVYHTELPNDEFDLVHVRYVAGTAGEPKVLLREMIRLARPGGVIALQEPDISTLNCYPPHPAWDRLKEVQTQTFLSVGANPRLGQSLYQLVRAAGVQDVHYRPFFVGVRSGDPMTDFLPSTVESLRNTMIEKNLIQPQELDQLIAACRAHLAKADTVFTFVTTVQVWGRVKE